MGNKAIYQEVRNWIYRNARPLELARWQYYFEDGEADDILKALSAYQNPDGGFGHALECDYWNPSSSPIQTFHAVQLLQEFSIMDKNHPVLQGILKYLDSGADFNGRHWFVTVPTNDDHPHAPWWLYDSESTSHHIYNPTAGLAGFGLCYSEQGSALYKKCAVIAMDAVECLLQSEVMDMHVLKCFISLYEFCEQADIDDLLSMAEFKKKLKEFVSRSITRDTGIWATHYICKPSMFYNSSDSMFYEENKSLTDFECNFIRDTRNKEGVWDITWSWADYPEEWAISKNWWKASVATSNLLYLKNFGRLEKE